jgi:hypothetical protein
MGHQSTGSAVDVDAVTPVRLLETAVPERVVIGNMEIKNTRTKVKMRTTLAFILLSPCPYTSCSGVDLKVYLDQTLEETSISAQKRVCG